MSEANDCWNTCPSCQSSRVQVTDSRPHHDGLWRRRRRICTACKHRWSTMEVPAELVENLPDTVMLGEKAIEGLNVMQRDLATFITLMKNTIAPVRGKRCL